MLVERHHLLLKLSSCIELQDQVQERSFVAERLAAFTCSPDGSSCAGGGISGAIYMWDVPSGRLLRTWPAHYQVCNMTKHPDAAMLRLLVLLLAGPPISHSQPCVCISCKHLIYCAGQ